MFIDQIISSEKRYAERPHQVKKTVKDYVTGKDSDPQNQKDMINRTVSVAQEGAKQVRRELAAQFTTPDNNGQPVDALKAQIDANTETQSLTRDGLVAQLQQEHQPILAGQELKLGRMEQFTQQMMTWADEYVDTLQAANSSLTQEKISLLRAETRKLVVDATRLVTYQDTKATAITLGDHGWMHLTQDMRDSITIAEGKRGSALSAKEKLILGLAAAYHDVGYATPEVIDHQISSQGKYGKFDKGHPINSFVFLVSEAKRFRAILGGEDADALFQIVANHENPQMSAQALKRADLAAAFAMADAGAAFGPDKLPASIVQIPEFLTYLSTVATFSASFDSQILPMIPSADLKRAQDTQLAIEQQIKDTPVENEIFIQELNTRLAVAKEVATKAKTTHELQTRASFMAEVINPQKEAVIKAILAKIKDQGGADLNSGTLPELNTQAGAMINAIDHYGPVSLKFLLGRMSAESAPPRVEKSVVDGNSTTKVVFDISAGHSRQMEDKHVIRNSIVASAKLTIKLFAEQANIPIDDQTEKLLIKILSANSTEGLDPSQLDTLANQGIKVSAVADNDPKNAFIALESDSVAVHSYGNRPTSPANADFYAGIEHHLEAANLAMVNWINAENAKNSGV